MPQLLAPDHNHVAGQELGEMLLRSNDRVRHGATGWHTAPAWDPPGAGIEEAGLQLA